MPGTGQTHDAGAGAVGSPPLLSIRNLVKTREGRDRGFEVILPELDLRVGQFCALVGPSGSGKSTLLDLIGLVLEPTYVDRYALSGIGGGDAPARGGGMTDIAGIWSMPDGDDEAAAIRRNAMGYVLQSGGLFPFLSVGENIDLPRRMISMKVNRARTVGELGRFGLDWGYDKRVSELSGGERQRVAILRALAHGPRLVLADEPTAAVDRARARQVVVTLKRYAQELGAAVIMVTHDISLVKGLADVWVRLARDTEAPAGISRFYAVIDQDPPA